MIEAIKFFFILFAHFLGDFTLQPSWMTQFKKKDPWTLIGHCFVYTGVISIALFLLGNLAGWKILYIFFGHMIMDFLKHKVMEDWSVHLKNSIDQVFHLVQLIVVYIIW